MFTAMGVWPAADANVPLVVFMNLCHSGISFGDRCARGMANRPQRFRLALALLVLATGASAKAAQCTPDQANAADAVIDYIDSWKNMHLAFEQFQQCDDGAIAEGFSEADARLMADHWSNLSDGLAFLRADPSFKRFVIRHLDETDNNADLAKIDRLARMDCPAAAKSFCAEVHASLTSSGCDPDFPQAVGCSSSDHKAVRKSD